MTCITPCSETGLIGTPPSQQVQGAGSQRGHHAGTVASVAVGDLMELVDPDPGNRLGTADQICGRGAW
jgi:hypothetical protein